jgi:exopolysaccharide biosynthesis protein
LKNNSILELAQLMKRLGCEYAINLDGGGSSILFMHGKVVNHPLGDINENNGQRIIRPISDAIIFKRNTNI